MRRFSALIALLGVFTVTSYATVPTDDSGVAVSVKPVVAEQPLSPERDWHGYDDLEIVPEKSQGLPMGEKELAQQELAVSAIEKLDGKVTLDGKAVVGVTFRKKELSDADLAHLKNLKYLKTLHLRRSKITDAGLEHLKNLVNLERVIIWGAGDITDAGLRYLRNLEHLKRLTICRSKVDGPGQVRFNITDNGLLYLEDLPCLEALEVWGGSRITDDGLAYLKKHAGLKRLSICRSQITNAGLVHLQNLTELEMLCVHDTKITGDGLAHLKKMTKLKRLCLHSNQLTNDCLVHMEPLRSLSDLCIHNTPVSSIEHLKKVKSLGQLCIRKTQIPEGNVKALKQVLPDCGVSR